jgi:hypothetical protein
MALGYPFENNTFVFSAYYDDLINPEFKFSFNSGSFTMNLPELDVKKNELGLYISDIINSEYEIRKNDNFLFLILENRSFMILFYEDLLCILIDSKTGDTFWGINSLSDYVRLGSRIKDTWVGVSNVAKSFVKYSSVFQEKINSDLVYYNGYGKYYMQIGVPWVPAQQKNGIGEWIQKEVFHETNEFVIVNGFVKADRQDLFYANSRIKTISIVTEIGTWDFELCDNPNPQIIQLPVTVKGKVKLIIKDVYKGEKYNDVCLAAFYILIKAP